MAIRTVQAICDRTKPARSSVPRDTPIRRKGADTIDTEPEEAITQKSPRLLPAKKRSMSAATASIVATLRRMQAILMYSASVFDRGLEIICVT